jgi:mycothiol synthase
MPYLVRSWNVQDDGCERTIAQAVYPEYREEPGHPSWFPAQQLGAPRQSSSRYVAIDATSEQPAGYATLWELRPRRYRFDLAVRPESQRRGLATELLSRVTRDAQAGGATGLQARVRDDQPIALGFVARRGFRESHRMGAYRIDFAKVEMSGYQDGFARLRAQGLDVSNLAAGRDVYSDWVVHLYQLRLAAREGWPDPDPDPAGPGPLPFERFQSWLEELENPDAFFIARHAGRPVAFTSMFGIGTAVHPEYRHRGIATQLKAGSIADAARRGLRGQTTNIASPAMQRIFEKLGYRRLWSEVRLIRTLEQPAAGD